MPDIDITIIGGGIVGTAIADAVARRGRGVVLLEKNARLAAGTTSRNSEVAHGGMYYPAGSLKALCCVRGRRMLEDFCREANVGYRRCGKLIVAVEKAQEDHLIELMALGQANDVEDLRLIDRAEIKSLEPQIKGTAALFSPATGILDAEGLTLALAARAGEHGAQMMTSARATGLQRRDGQWQVQVHREGGESWTHDSAVVINAAGLQADDVAAMAGVDTVAQGMTLEWVKGSYFSIAPRHNGRVQRLIYPVPDPATDTLGVHLCLDLGGQMRLGPDYQPFPRTEDYTVDADRQDSFFREAVPFLPFLEEEDLQPAMCGLRPKLAPHREFSDFLIQRHDAQLAGLINLVGMDSPGLTSAPAVAEIVADLLEDKDVPGVRS
jgi:L-2-hydroxyglutarate oxidase LhgO